VLILLAEIIHTATQLNQEHIEIEESEAQKKRKSNTFLDARPLSLNSLLSPLFLLINYKN
jgi:hypothetical protein